MSFPCSPPNLESASLVQREVARLAVTEGLCLAEYSLTNNPSVATRQLPLHKGALIAASLPLLGRLVSLQLDHGSILGRVRRPRRTENVSRNNGKALALFLAIVTVRRDGVPYRGEICTLT